MSVYICLVVWALLAPAADSAKCVIPDQYVVTLQNYYQNVYANVSISSSRRMVSATKYSLDVNKNSIPIDRTVSDFNVMVQFVISANGSCKATKLYNQFLNEITDDAVKQDEFPVKLPDDLPKGIQFWWLQSPDGKNSDILGVLPITQEVCGFAVYGHIHGEIFQKESVIYIKGNYSLSIQNMDVFVVPSQCFKKNN